MQRDEDRLAKVDTPGSPTKTTPSLGTKFQSYKNERESNLLPSISLPKGGGAIRGIGEKLSVNAVTGTASVSVPLTLSPGRSESDPQLSLAYESGSGNGPFGFGWGISLPSVTRKTDKGLPRYRDEEESDVFILSGSEDLVPVLDSAQNRILLSRIVHGIFYNIRLYRPRIEGLFARIERWTNQTTGISHWRTISRDNVTTLFGFDENSRIADPNDPRRVFSYLICLTLDGKGNATHYEYAPEDSAGIDPAPAHEANRTTAGRGSQRYLKRIRYGNAQPYFPDWAETGTEKAVPTAWHFEVVFDYGDHSLNSPTPKPDQSWSVRPDPFSTYRAGFEVRTYRRCKRVLVFHNFPDETAVGADCLVRSFDLLYHDEVVPADTRNPVYTFLESITQTGYGPRSSGGYKQRSMPPLEFSYSEPQVDQQILTLDETQSRENLPEGVDGSRFRLIDLDGEGLSGILTEQNGAWGYKRNLSPINRVTVPGGQRVARARFGPLEQIPSLPVPAKLSAGQRLLDLSGGGRLALAAFENSMPGYFTRTADYDWEPLQTFKSLPRIDWAEPNLQFVDLTGDGRADVLITEDDVYTFYPSLGTDGFGEAERVLTPWDEERGPRVVFADGTQTVSLADMSGHGLSDIVRIRNGEVCYWPNLGYGRFGAKVTMDDSPRFADEEHFDARRVRLADVDGSGTADLLYIGDDGVQVCFNQSGNAWSQPNLLAVFPGADNLSSVQLTDLLGNGTACLVWSSPLPGESYAPLRYVDLMGSQKPHLLKGISNNLGAETRFSYAPSTRFYLEDKDAGRPWITRLHFPVQVVERVESYDWVGRSRFVTRYAYHHGYFDSVEREFRGFGMVEQWDTEIHHDDTSFADLETTNEDAASFVSPVLTRTWFHNGAFFEAAAVSRQYESEYWYEPSSTGGMLLPDTVLEDGLSPEEIREAHRALKGSALRVEVYAQDGTPKASNPYTVTEQNFTVHRVQPFGPNQHAVFMTHARESVTCHHERQTQDPRITHDFNVEIDAFGNVRRSASVAYGRRTGYPEPEPTLSDAFRTMLAHDQQRLHIAATEHRFTAPVNQPTDAVVFDAYRAPLPCETIKAELTGVALPTGKTLFPFAAMEGYTGLPGQQLIVPYATLWDGSHDVPYEDVLAPDIQGTGAPAAPARRIVEHSLTLYRSDDLTKFLDLGVAESLALPGESYHLALTPSLISRIFGTKLNDTILKEGGYVQLAGGQDWWVPSGRIFYSADDTDKPTEELNIALNHFYRPRRAVDPFGAISRIEYDAYDLMPRNSADALGNLTAADNDYRVLGPTHVTDANGNLSDIGFDCLGQVVGTAVSSKTGEGDSLTGFNVDLTPQAIDNFINSTDPHDSAPALLGQASSRIIYDLSRFKSTRDQNPNDPTQWQPVFAATLARETHVQDSFTAGLPSKIQIGFVYSDGFGREAQHKAQAKRGPIPNVGNDISPRWIASGWTIFNNKGKPVRKYEPFFSPTHQFEFGRRMGVSSVVFYDPMERVVATLHPDNTWEKTVFDAWRQETWDGNDTVAIADPREDEDAGDSFQRLLGRGAFTSWYDLRKDGTIGNTADEQKASKDAAQKAKAHAGTPTVTHFDSLGRTCLSVADNVSERHPTRTALDTENKPLAVFDALGHRVMEYFRREPDGAGFRYVAGYDLGGRELYHNGMDGGERWILNNVLGNPIRKWDARGFTFRILYDALRRPTHEFVQPSGADEILSERLIYGEKHPDAGCNLKGKLFRHYDGAGFAGNDRYDFKGNLLESSRQLALTYRKTPDWSAISTIRDSPNVDLGGLDSATAPLLDAADKFNFASRFDALNRPIQVVTPHRAATPSNQPSVIQRVYNEANLLDRVDVWIRQATAPAALLDPSRADMHAVTKIDYDAHGRRILIEQGNGTATAYIYDPETFRLTALTTNRTNSDPNAQTVQALGYFYDPVGNITRIRDSADIQNVIYFRNQRVEPSADYTYDAVYRLTVATGREHLGQNGPVPVTNDDGPRTQSTPGVPILNPSDGTAMGNYEERYFYDSVGNILEIRHRGTNPSQPGWKRCYQYALDSNRLLSTGNPANPHNPDSPCSIHYYSTAVLTDKYEYDAHGNMVRMPHLPRLAWDQHNRLQSTTRQVVTAGTPETTYCTYDGEGQRICKITEPPLAVGATPRRKSERIYLDAFEIYREYDSVGVSLERETQHIMDDNQRIAIVETRTLGIGPAPTQLTRYQYGNHLGSAALELDDQAEIVSYEEYFPYGSTSHRAVRNQTDAAPRYRYTSKERDEESDLYYHGARYYSSWLARWTAVEPKLPALMSRGDAAASANGYVYTNGNPVVHFDPDGEKPRKSDPPKGLTFAPTSKLQAKDVNHMIQVNPHIPPWLKKAFDVVNNKLIMRNIRNASDPVLPDWVISMMTAIQSDQWHVTTSSTVRDHTTGGSFSFKNVDFEPQDKPGVRISYPNPKGVGGPWQEKWSERSLEIPKAESSIDLGATVPLEDYVGASGKKYSGSSMRRDGTSTRGKRGLIVVVNRADDKTDPTSKETGLDPDIILEALFHELAAHGGRINEGREEGENDPEVQPMVQAIKSFFEIPISKFPFFKANRPPQPTLQTAPKESPTELKR